MKTAAVFLAGMLAACSAPLPVANNVSAVEVNGTEDVMPSEGDPGPEDTAATAADAGFLGRWTGVEGMYLNVAAKPGGGVTLDMRWDLDHRGSFDGSIAADGVRFTRNGVTETARRTNGDATGLKYLAGKADCLTVKPGEGYCRD